MIYTLFVCIISSRPTFMQRGRRRISVMKERQKGREKKKDWKCEKEIILPRRIIRGKSILWSASLCIVTVRLCVIYIRASSEGSPLYQFTTVYDRYLEKPKSVISPHVEAETRRLSLEYIYICFVDVESKRKYVSKIVWKRKKKKRKIYEISIDGEIAHV